jgi:hypothetical protein
LTNNEKKLYELAVDWGYAHTEELFEYAAYDSVCPAICMNCDYTTEMEPDQGRGYCEICGTNTVKSALVLAGVI